MQEAIAEHYPEIILQSMVDYMECATGIGRFESN